MRARRTREVASERGSCRNWSQRGSAWSIRAEGGRMGARDASMKGSKRGDAATAEGKRAYLGEDGGVRESGHVGVGPLRRAAKEREVSFAMEGQSC